MAQKDGGPAFPCDAQWEGAINPTCVQEQSAGMSLRDYLAAHAPDKPAWFMTYDTEEIRVDAMENLIRWRWYYADAMLKERDSFRHHAITRREP